MIKGVLNNMKIDKRNFVITYQKNFVEKCYKHTKKLWGFLFQL